MKNFKNKNIYFSGRGEKVSKDELIKYLIQNGAIIIDNEKDPNIIIQGYATSSYDQDRYYLLSKDGIEIIDIESLEKEFSVNLDIDSILLAIKISKDNIRVVELLKNRYFSDEIFVKILKYYNFENQGLYDSDENRDVCTSITQRFCSLTSSNHNIQHSPIGIYYTALETTNSKLLEIIYYMPHFSISDKNAKEDQPLSLKEVVALNPNTPKPILIDILKQNNKKQLLFLAQNSSLNKLIKNKLLELNDQDITLNLIKADNIEYENIDNILASSKYKKELLKNIKLSDEIFSKLIALSLSDIDIVNLSSNSSLTTSQIDILFEKNIDNANINLLKNKMCSLAQIEKFLNLNDKIYNISIAHNTSLKDEIYKQLLCTNDFDIELTLALNSSTPKDILRDLFKKNSDEINNFLSQNIATPIDILMQLQVDNRYNSNVANNETYKEFSRNSLGIIADQNSQFRRNTYMDTV